MDRNYFLLGLLNVSPLQITSPKLQVARVGIVLPTIHSSGKKGATMESSPLADFPYKSLPEAEPWSQKGLMPLPYYLTISKTGEEVAVSSSPRLWSVSQMDFERSDCKAAFLAPAPHA